MKRLTLAMAGETSIVTTTSVTVMEPVVVLKPSASVTLAVTVPTLDVVNKPLVSMVAILMSLTAQV